MDYLLPSFEDLEKGILQNVAMESVQNNDETIIANNDKNIINNDETNVVNDDNIINNDEKNDNIINNDETNIVQNNKNVCEENDRKMNERNDINDSGTSTHNNLENIADKIFKNSNEKNVEYNRGRNPRNYDLNNVKNTYENYAMYNNSKPRIDIDKIKQFQHGNMNQFPYQYHYQHPPHHQPYPFPSLPFNNQSMGYNPNFENVIDLTMDNYLTYGHHYPMPHMVRNFYPNHPPYPPLHPFMPPLMNQNFPPLHYSAPPPYHPLDMCPKGVRPKRTTMSPEQKDTLLKITEIKTETHTSYNDKTMNTKQTRDSPAQSDVEHEDTSKYDGEGKEGISKDVFLLNDDMEMSEGTESCHTKDMSILTFEMKLVEIADICGSNIEVWEYLNRPCVILQQLSRVVLNASGTEQLLSDLGNNTTEDFFIIQDENVSPTFIGKIDKDGVTTAQIGLEISVISNKHINRDEPYILLVPVDVLIGILCDVRDQFKIEMCDLMDFVINILQKYPQYMSDNDISSSDEFDS